MKGYKHLAPEQRTQILAVYQETLSAKITAARVHVSYQKVLGALRRADIIPSGATNGACYRNIDLVRKMAIEGQSIAAIAAQIGTNRHNVRRFLKQHDIPRKVYVQRKDMEHNPHWKGGRMIDKDGYVLIRLGKGHPDADSHGYIREHRLVMAEKLGRPLTPEEVPHHKDDNHSNNEPDNLELYPSNAEHLRQTLKGKRPNWTEDGWRRMKAPRPQRRGPKQTANPIDSALDDAQ